MMTNLLRLLTFIILLGSMGAPGMAQPKQEVWYHTGYPGGVGGPGSGMSALTGPTKMPAIFEAILRNRLVEPGQIHTDSLSVTGRASFAPPIDLESLRAVHTDRYLKALFTGEPRSLAMSQGLPTWNEKIAEGWLLNVGGLYAASETALYKRTITANLGHGYHHAAVNRGMGFCTINGLVVAAKKLIRQEKAKRVMIIDLDHHEGNGTAESILGEPRIWNVSIYGSYMGGPLSAENNHVFHVRHDALEMGRKRDAHYLAIVSDVLPRLIRLQDPDLILYQAGMDPFDGAGISRNALAIRDAYVFSLCLSLDKPVTWVLAGGYADLNTLVELHTDTVRMANEVLRSVPPGSRIVHQRASAYEWVSRERVITFPSWKLLVEGKLEVHIPERMSGWAVQEFMSERERVLREERLPDDEIQSVYRRLFVGKSSP